MAESVERAEYLRARARRLYLRANRYGMRGLEASYAGFGAAFEGDPPAALARARKPDVPLLYWTAASLGLAISTAKDDAKMIAQRPVVEAIIQRAGELDEGWGAGAIPEFLISLEASRSGRRPADQQATMRKHFARSLEFSKGAHASAFVSLAENACVPAQNRTEFRAMLEKALQVDTTRSPDGRLANLMAQRRARWLLGRADELFLEPEPKK